MMLYLSSVRAQLRAVSFGVYEGLGWFGAFRMNANMVPHDKDDNFGTCSGGVMCLHRFDVAPREWRGSEHDTKMYDMRN